MQKRIKGFETKRSTYTIDCANVYNRLYLVESYKMVKIGQASNVKRRLKYYFCGSVFPIFRVYVSPEITGNLLDAERLAQSFLRNRIRTTEWYADTYQRGLDAIFYTWNNQKEDVLDGVYQAMFNML